MTDEALFDAEQYRTTSPAGEPEHRLSVDRRRTARQAAAIARGMHPLSIVFGAGLRLHPDADRGACRTDRGALPLRCGSCKWRSVGGYPKCTRSPSFMTGSAVTDCRAWWPACTYYEEAESD